MGEAPPGSEWGQGRGVSVCIRARRCPCVRHLAGEGTRGGVVELPGASHGNVWGVRGCPAKPASECVARASGYLERAGVRRRHSGPVWSRTRPPWHGVLSRGAPPSSGGGQPQGRVRRAWRESFTRRRAQLCSPRCFRCVFRRLCRPPFSLDGGCAPVPAVNFLSWLSGFRCLFTWPSPFCG